MNNLQPIDYTLRGVQNPADSFMAGMNQTLGLQNVFAAREEAKRKAIEEQRARNQQETMAADMAALAQNPTVMGINRMIAKYPSISKQYEPILASMTEQQRRSRTKQVLDVYAPLMSGRKDLAIENLDVQLDAAKNSGDEQAVKSLNTIKSMLDSAETGESGDNLVKTALGTYIAYEMGPDNFAKTFEGLGKEARETAEAPAKLSKAQSEASTAATKAKFAESEAVMDLQKKGWDIKKIESDIDINKENARIAAINSSISRESNDIKRQELMMKLQDMQANRDKAVREKAYEAETAIGSVDESSRLISDILSDDDTLRASVGKSAWRASIIGTKSYTMKGKIEQLQNSIAATNLDKLKGAMSDKDIVFLKNIATNLSRFQNEDEFIKELHRIQSNLNAAKEKLSRKFGVPVGSGPASSPSSEPHAARNISVDY